MALHCVLHGDQGAGSPWEEVRLSLPAEEFPLAGRYRDLVKYFNPDSLLRKVILLGVWKMDARGYSPGIGTLSAVGGGADRFASCTALDPAAVPLPGTCMSGPATSRRLDL